jgi:hypothetical protein
MAPRSWFFCSWWWLPLVFLVIAAEAQGEGCSGSAQRCGNLTISDPFWLIDTKTGRSCGSGSTDFEVSCENNALVLRGYGISGFAISNITYEERSLRAIDLGKLQLLQASNSCYAVQSWNTSAKLGPPFRISNINLNLILYNCTEWARRDDRGLVETKIGCGNQHKVFVSIGGHYDDTSNSGYAVEGCEAIVVPVLGGAANMEANASNYEQLIRDGFLMTWDATPLAQDASRKFGHPVKSSFNQVAS